MHLEGNSAQQVSVEDLGKRGSLQYFKIAVLKDVLFDLVVQVAQYVNFLFLIVSLDYLLTIKELCPRLSLQCSRDIDFREVPIELPEVGLEHIRFFSLHFDK